MHIDGTNMINQCNEEMEINSHTIPLASIVHLTSSGESHEEKKIEYGQLPISDLLLLSGNNNVFNFTINISNQILSPSTEVHPILIPVTGGIVPIVTLKEEIATNKGASKAATKSEVAKKRPSVIEQQNSARAWARKEFGDKKKILKKENKINIDN
jgi:hypothetical protein